MDKDPMAEHVSRAEKVLEKLSQDRTLHAVSTLAEEFRLTHIQARIQAQDEAAVIMRDAAKRMYEAYVRVEANATDIRFPKEENVRRPF